VSMSIRALLSKVRRSVYNRPFNACEVACPSTMSMLRANAQRKTYDMALQDASQYLIPLQDESQRSILLYDEGADEDDDKYDDDDDEVDDATIMMQHPALMAGQYKGADYDY